MDVRTGTSMEMRDVLARTAPGTGLRSGLERVVSAKGGALVVLSDAPEVLKICSGGFWVDSPFNATRLSELAKMDGAIILSADGGRLLRANVHLVPEASVSSTETGTRHRTAQKVARSLDVPVVSVSEEMGVIQVYAGGQKHQLRRVAQLLDRSNQALQTLERYKTKLDDALSSLTRAELEDAVTVRDVVAVIQRGEMVHRIFSEIEIMTVELGVEARLLRLQLDEIYSDIDDEIELVIADYLPPHRNVDDTLGELERLDDDDVLDARSTACVLHIPGVELSGQTTPRGLRILNKIDGLSDGVARRVSDEFGSLARIQRASVGDLAAVIGADTDLAHTIKAGLDHLTLDHLTP